LIFFGPIAEIYSNPQVYFFNPIIGFFPGNIYDEDISVNSTLIMYRVLNIMFFLGILLAIGKLKIKSQYYKVYSITLTIIIAIGFSFIKPSLGFATSNSKIWNELGGRLSTPHFNIIYPKDSDNKFIELLGLHHEYYFEELVDFFDFEPTQKITSYIFKNDAQKRKLFGAGRADVAKPWMNQIYIELNSFDHSLKHELAHIFTAEIGTTPFKIAENFNPAMIEGIAVAIEDNYNDNDVHFIAALAKKYGHEIKIENLFSGFSFFSGLSTLSYIYSGSFIKYLFENYEKEEVLKLYSEIDFQKHLGKDITLLATEYSTFLDSLDYDFNEHEANLYFGRRPLFKKICPRYMANKLKAAWSDYNKKNYNASHNQFSELLTTTESYSALLGTVYSLIKLGENESALDKLTDRIDNYNNTSYLYNIELVLSDTFLRNDKFKNSDSLLVALFDQSPSKAHYFSTLNRRLLLNKNIDVAKRYIDSDNKEKWEILINFNKDSLYLASVFSLIRLAGSENEKYQILKNILNNNFKVKNDNSAYLAYQFSKLALRNSDFKTACNWVVEANKFVPSRYELIYKEHLKIINWFINHNNEIINEFEITINE